MKMKFIKYLIALVATAPLMTACLYSNLDDLPVYSDSKITDMKAEFRYYGEEKWENNPIVLRQGLPLVGKILLDDKALTAEATFSIPAASGTFTTAVRNTVNLKNTTVWFTISAASICKPIGNAPVLGVPGDWSNPPYQYEIMAADGKTSVWKVTVKLQ